MVEAIHMQTQDWGFSLDGWSNAGNTRLGVALSEGVTWFHGPAPERGHSGISINVNGGDNADYKALTDGLMSTFHHELFHIFQYSSMLANEGDGDFNGKDKAWRFFSEGMASFISSAAQPEIQFNQSGEARAYMDKAVHYVGGRGYPGDLNNSYAGMDPYHAALYWRFLYEQCDGLSNSTGAPDTGMLLIRRIMQVLYGKEVVDMSASADLVRELPALMDLALSGPEASYCPFRTFRESLTLFASAIYKLRLDEGRCSAPGFPDGCGLYDPNQLYSSPRTSTLTYLGKEIIYAEKDQSYPPGIRSSYGMDFIDISLNSNIQGQPLTLELHSDPAGIAEFNIQVIHLLDQGSGLGSNTFLVQDFPVVTLEKQPTDGSLTVAIPPVDLNQFNRLGVIVTRTDANEAMDPVGAYRLVVKP
jgi:hypothetical protein